MSNRTCFSASCGRDAPLASLWPGKFAQPAAGVPAYRLHSVVETEDRASCTAGFATVLAGVPAREIATIQFAPHCSAAREIEIYRGIEIYSSVRAALASLHCAAIRTRPERADNVPPGTRTLPHRLTAKPTTPDPTRCSVAFERPPRVLGGPSRLSPHPPSRPRPPRPHRYRSPTPRAHPTPTPPHRTGRAPRAQHVVHRRWQGCRVGGASSRALAAPHRRAQRRGWRSRRR